MKRTALALVFMVSGLLRAFDEAKLTPITIVGTVVDTGCYMVHDGIGADHAK